MNYQILRIFEDADIRIYKRLWKEPGIKLYFVYNVKQDEMTGDEFKSKSQVVSFLKKLGKITV